MDEMELRCGRCEESPVRPGQASLIAKAQLEPSGRWRLLWPNRRVGRQHMAAFELARLAGDETLAPEMMFHVLAGMPADQRSRIVAAMPRTMFRVDVGPARAAVALICFGCGLEVRQPRRDVWARLDRAASAGGTVVYIS